MTGGVAGFDDSIKG